MVINFYFLPLPNLSLPFHFLPPFPLTFSSSSFTPFLTSYSSFFSFPFFLFTSLSHSFNSSFSPHLPLLVISFVLASLPTLLPSRFFSPLPLPLLFHPCILFHCSFHLFFFLFSFTLASFHTALSSSFSNTSHTLHILTLNTLTPHPHTLCPSPPFFLPSPTPFFSLPSSYPFTPFRSPAASRRLSEGSASTRDLPSDAECDLHW